MMSLNHYRHKSVSHYAYIGKHRAANVKLNMDLMDKPIKVPKKVMHTSISSPALLDPCIIKKGPKIVDHHVSPWTFESERSSNNVNKK